MITSISLSKYPVSSELPFCDTEVLSPNYVILKCTFICRSLSVGTRNGYKLYSLTSLSDKPELIFEKGKT